MRPVPDDFTRCSKDNCPRAKKCGRKAKTKSEYVSRDYFQECNKDTDYEYFLKWD